MRFDLIFSVIPALRGDLKPHSMQPEIAAFAGMTRAYAF